MLEELKHSVWSVCVCARMRVYTCAYVWKQGLSLPRKAEATSCMATMRMMNASV